MDDRLLVIVDQSRDDLFTTLRRDDDDSVAVMRDRRQPGAAPGRFAIERRLRVQRATLEKMLAMKPAAALAFFTAMVREFCTRLAATDDLVSEVTRWGLEATGLDSDLR